jgi:hypothetical protein
LTRSSADSPTSPRTRRRSAASWRSAEPSWSAAKKRLGSLRAARPAHADELDALHASLPKLYAQYLEKHRNLAFLEASLAARRADEEAAAAKRDDALRAMRGRLREEEMRVLRGEENVGDDFEDEFDDELEEEDDRREKDGGFVKKKNGFVVRRPVEEKRGRRRRGPRGASVRHRGRRRRRDRADWARACEARGRGLRDGGGRQRQRRRRRLVLGRKRFLVLVLRFPVVR